MYCTATQFAVSWFDCYLKTEHRTGQLGQSMEFDNVDWTTAVDGVRHCCLWVLRLSMEFDIVELWKNGCSRSEFYIAELLNERRQLNVELKETAGSPGCDTTYRAERRRRTRYETVRLLRFNKLRFRFALCALRFSLCAFHFALLSASPKRTFALFLF